MSTKSIIKLIIGIVFVAVVFAFFEQVSAGERVVVLRLGKVARVLEPGLHVVTPFVDRTVTMDVRVRLLEMDAEASSKDLQEVGSTIGLNFHLDPNQVGTIYEDVGKRYTDRLITPAVQESVKAGMALFTAEEQINKRNDVKEAIKADLSERLAKFHIIVDDVSILDFSFSAEFDRAIEDKQVADQKAQKAENDLERVKFEQQQSIEKFKAEAESTKLQVDALQNSSKIIELRKVEALLEISKGVDNWKGSLCIINCSTN